MDKFTTHTGTAPPSAAQQCRHRPDHPGGLPQAGHQDRLRGRAVRGLAQRPELRAQPAAVRGCDDLDPRPRLRHRLVPRARGMGPAELRLQGRHRFAVRRHLPGQLGKAGLLIAVVDQKIIEELWDFVEAHPDRADHCRPCRRRITRRGFPGGSRSTTTPDGG